MAHGYGGAYGGASGFGVAFELLANPGGGWREKYFTRSPARWSVPRVVHSSSTLRQPLWRHKCGRLYAKASVRVSLKADGAWAEKIFTLRHGTDLSSQATHLRLLRQSLRAASFGGSSGAAASINDPMGSVGPEQILYNFANNGVDG